MRLARVTLGEHHVAVVQALHLRPLPHEPFRKNGYEWHFAPQCCAWQSVCWRRRVRRRLCPASASAQPPLCLFAHSHKSEIVPCKRLLGLIAHHQRCRITQDLACANLISRPAARPNIALSFVVPSRSLTHRAQLPQTEQPPCEHQSNASRSKKKGANPSVKPTRSGLRPPRAAYLIRSASHKCSSARLESPDAKVLWFTPIDQRHEHTGSTVHSINGTRVGLPAALAICQYEHHESGFFSSAATRTGKRRPTHGTRTPGQAQEASRVRVQRNQGNVDPGTNANVNLVSKPSSV